MSKLDTPSRIEKYDIAGPRYTSYPAVPFWKNDPLSVKDWKKTIKRNLEVSKSKNISVYVHLPYCESLCTFCGCHKRITKNHSVEKPYIDSVIKEWKLYHEPLEDSTVIRELHFGGGTPTFFSADELLRLVEELFEVKKVNPDEVELSFEAHPNNTSNDHLDKLYNFGFRRISLGVQDYSPLVQKAINRIQPFEQVKAVHDYARNAGYSSISHDLVFGLPKQSMKDIIYTVTKTLELKPERISLYSYAHVPWIKGNGQRGFDESDLPSGNVKRALYEASKKMLLEADYIEVGMDHFALKTDSLAIAFKEKSLHRNFMGYTTKSTDMMIGLGISAISDSWYGFAQNEKHVEDYLRRINEADIPVFRGHILSELDIEIRGYILDLMCHFETCFNSDSKHADEHVKIKERLSEMVLDGLVAIEGDKVRVNAEGVPFVRNCCMAFDQNLNVDDIPTKMFSRTI